MSRDALSPASRGSWFAAAAFFAAAAACAIVAIFWLTGAGRDAETVSAAQAAIVKAKPKRPIATAAGVKGESSPAFPQVGWIIGDRISVRSAADRNAEVVKVFNQFRPDYRPTPLHAFEMKEVNGVAWYHIRIPGRPNGQTGWVLASQATWEPLQYRIVIDLSSRTLRLFKDGKIDFKTDVAVGAPGMETPTGSFYVQSGFAPSLDYLGDYAFETSAYSKLSDWPGGGIIGIHGWNDPSVMGKAVSHGCIRLTNPSIRYLRDNVPVGTSVDIKQ